jgi:RNA polymerase sigma-70 factor, ECF subfamily
MCETPTRPGIAVEGSSPMAPNPAEPPGPRESPVPPVDEAWAHRDELVLYARRLLGAQRELAEDVVQEAFLRLHERAAGGAAVREARPWLFRVTRNLALDERRRNRRGEEVRTTLEVVATEPKGPLEVVQGREEARQALRGLGSLPPRERRTVILDQAGLAPPAIARRMQTTTNAVHQSLFRARRRLRDARAAAWGLLPLPIIRLLVRMASSPALDRLPPLTPGGGGRFAGGAGVVGLVAAAVIGTSVVADRPEMLHPVHHRAAAVERAPARATGTSATEVAGTGAPALSDPAPPPSAAVVHASRTVPREIRAALERRADPRPVSGLSAPSPEVDGDTGERDAPRGDSATPRIQGAGDAATEGSSTESWKGRQASAADTAEGTPRPSSQEPEHDAEPAAPSEAPPAPESE